MFSAFSVTLDEKEMKVLEEGSGADLTQVTPEQLSAKDAVAATSEQAQACLKDYATIGKALDAQALQGKWLDSDIQVLIAHSLKDKALASRLAVWMNQEFGISVVLDSDFWECANDMTKCDGKDLTGYASSHVHVMSGLALTKLIESCECVFFLNSGSFLDCAGDSEECAWIYAELEATRLIRKKKPERFRNRNFVLSENTQLRIEFDEKLGHLLPLRAQELQKWMDRHYALSDEVNPFDLLYLQRQIII